MAVPKKIKLAWDFAGTGFDGSAGRAAWQRAQFGPNGGSGLNSAQTSTAGALLGGMTGGAALMNPNGGAVAQLGGSMMQAVAGAYMSGIANPAQTQRQTYQNIAEGLGSAAPMAGAAVGSALFGPIGGAVGYGVGSIVDTIVKRSYASDNAIQRPAEQEMGGVLAELGAAGVDSTRPELQEGLQMMAESAVNRHARSYANVVNSLDKITAPFSTVGKDSSGIWTGV